VGTPSRRAAERVDRGHHQVVERLRIGDPSHGPQRLLVQPPGDVAAGQVGVLAHHGVAHGRDRDLVGGQAVGVDPDVDRSEQAPDDPDVADAG